MKIKANELQVGDIFDGGKTVRRVSPAGVNIMIDFADPDGPNDFMFVNILKRFTRG